MHGVQQSNGTGRWCSQVVTEGQAEPTGKEKS
jgi:hypothetical protein